MRNNIKVHPHYAARQNATKCGLVVRQMARIMWTSMWLLYAAACHAAWKFDRQNVDLIKDLPRGIWWERGFKIASASLRKKSDEVHWSRSTVFVTWSKSAKNYFLIWMRLNWRHMPSNFCHAAKLQCVAFYHTAKCGRTLIWYQTVPGNFGILLSHQRNVIHQSYKQQLHVRMGK